jgi:outer membrane lipopolysaccharide assembly protein LptE/RlpB
LSLILSAAALSISGCGYHVGGKADLLPATIHTIAIPAFGNVTTRYKLTEMLPAAIGREFIARTRYRVVADPNIADAILTGAVTNVLSAPTIFDQKTGRAAGIQVMVFMNISLVERTSGKVLFKRQGMEIRQRYEVATSQEQYFDESTMALSRLSQEAARHVVSSILEAF